MRAQRLLVLSLLIVLHSNFVEPFKPVLFQKLPAKKLSSDCAPSINIVTRSVTNKRYPIWINVARGGDGASSSSSPQLSRWIGPALSSAFSYAMYNIFIKLGSSSISPLLGGVILQTVAALLGTILLGISGEKPVYDRKGILYSALAGLAVGAAELLSFSVSASGVQASRSTPIMIGGSVAFGSLLGFVILKERLTSKGWLGVFLVVAGIACVATDPGAKMAAH